MDRVLFEKRIYNTAGYYACSATQPNQGAENGIRIDIKAPEGSKSNEHPHCAEQLCTRVGIWILMASFHLEYNLRYY